MKVMAFERSWTQFIEFNKSIFKELTQIVSGLSIGGNARKCMAMGTAVSVCSASAIIVKRRTVRRINYGMLPQGQLTVASVIRNRSRITVIDSI